MSKILVTGGTGYIGSHTVVELHNAGFEVIAIDNFDNSYPDVIENIEKISSKKLNFENVDIRDKAALKAFISKHNDITAVIHFAANKAVGESVQFPLKYYENNVGGTVNLLQALRFSFQSRGNEQPELKKTQIN